MIQPWLLVNGVEWANAPRVLAYIVWARSQGVNMDHFDIPSLTAMCTPLYTETGTPGTGTFVSPTADPAPWYNAAEPGSPEFLGLLLDPQQIDGWDSDVVRTVDQRGAGLGGASIGPDTPGILELAFGGWLVATTQRGLDYGRRWLRNQARQCDACGLVDIVMRSSCPPPPYPANNSQGRWTMHGAAVTVMPQVDDDEPCPDLEAIKFSIVTENPWKYADAVSLVAASPLSTVSAGSPCIPIAQWLCGVGPETCGTVPAPVVGVNGAIITIKAGAAGAFNVGVYTGGGLYLADTLFLSDCLYLSDSATPIVVPNTTCPFAITIPYLPPGSTFVIDAALHRLVYTGADGVPLEGSPYISLPDGVGFVWPEVQSCDAALNLCASVSPVCGTEADSTVAIAYQHRED